MSSIRASLKWAAAWWVNIGCQLGESRSTVAQTWSGWWTTCSLPSMHDFLVKSKKVPNLLSITADNCILSNVGRKMHLKKLDEDWGVRNAYNNYNNSQICTRSAQLTLSMKEKKELPKHRLPIRLVCMLVCRPYLQLSRCGYSRSESSNKELIDFIKGTRNKKELPKHRLPIRLVCMLVCRPYLQLSRCGYSRSESSNKELIDFIKGTSSWGAFCRVILFITFISIWLMLESADANWWQVEAQHFRIYTYSGAKMGPLVILKYTRVLHFFAPPCIFWTYIWIIYSIYAMRCSSCIWWMMDDDMMGPTATHSI